MKALSIITLSILFSFSTENTSVQQTKKEEATVLICTGNYSKRYHKYECRGLKACKASINKLYVSDARKKGYSACKNCYR